MYGSEYRYFYILNSLKRIMLKLTKKIIQDINTEFAPKNINSIILRLYKNKGYASIAYTINPGENKIIGAFPIKGGKRAYNKSLDIIHEVWTYFSSRGVNARIEG